jgi:hypothetical protein
MYFVPKGATMLAIICGVYLVMPAAICVAVSVRNFIFGDVV